jgi:hypothetical protein
VLIDRSLPLVMVAIMGAVAVLLALLRPDMAVGYLLGSGGLPFNFVTGGQRSVLQSFGGSTVSGTLLVLYVGALLLILVANRQFMRSIVSFALPLTWVAWSTMTLVYTNWTDEGLRLSLKLWYPLLVGMAVLYVARSWPGFSNLRRWWYAGYALASGVALFRFLTEGVSVYSEGAVYRYTALNHPTPFSFFMTVSFIFSYSLWRHSRGKLDGLVALTAAIQTVLSMARISIGALVLTLLLSALLDSENVASLIRGLLVTAAVSASIVFALVAFPSLQGGVFVDQVSTASQVVNGTGTLDMQGRDMVWKIMLAQYRVGNRTIGQGIGSSTRLFKEGIIPAGGVAHSEYVRVLYEQGWVGLTWFIVVLAGSALYFGLRVWRTHGLERALVSAAFIGIAVYAVFCSTDNALDYYNVLGQYVTALAAFALVGAELAKQAAAAHEDVAQVLPPLTRKPLATGDGEG